jgi:multidrug efflux pump subunit AcrB
VGPIIAMTITLAAVYAPIGFQGGLTGALFREFAFTLAGAVVISGFVALTLSPMMSSKLIGAEGTRAPAGPVDRRSGFDGIKRSVYARALGATLSRPVVYGVWIVLTLLVVPMYMFSPQELAPNEDQGVVFGAIDVPANASLEQLDPYVDPGESDLRVGAGVRPQLPDHVPGERLRRHARQAVGAAPAKHLPDPGGAQREALPASRESAPRCSSPRRCRARASFRSSS